MANLISKTIISFILFNIAGLIFNELWGKKNVSSSLLLHRVVFLLLNNLIYDVASLIWFLVHYHIVNGNSLNTDLLSFYLTQNRRKQNKTKKLNSHCYNEYILPYFFFFLVSGMTHIVLAKTPFIHASLSFPDYNSPSPSPSGNSILKTQCVHMCFSPFMDCIKLCRCALMYVLIHTYTELVFLFLFLFLFFITLNCSIKVIFICKFL